MKRSGVRFPLAPRHQTPGTTMVLGVLCIIDAPTRWTRVAIMASHPLVDHFLFVRTSFLGPYAIKMVRTGGETDLEGHGATPFMAYWGKGLTGTLTRNPRPAFPPSAEGTRHGASTHHTPVVRNNTRHTAMFSSRGTRHTDAGRGGLVAQVAHRQVGCGGCRAGCPRGVRRAGP